MTSIFDIAGVVPTQEQAQRMSEPVPTPSPTLAQSQKQVFDDYSSILRRQEGIRRMQQGAMPQAPQMSREEADRLSGIVQANIMANRPQGFASQMAGAITGLPVGGVGQFMGGHLEGKLRAGGRPVYDGGRLVGVVHDGLLGGSVYSGEQAFNPYNMPQPEEDRQQVVLPETDAATGAKRCADGYIFDEQLGACRLAVTLPNQPEPTAYNFYQMPYEDEGLLGGYGANLFYG